MAIETTNGRLVLMAPTGEPIDSVDDWFAEAPPMRGEVHWHDDRSAKEWHGLGSAAGAPPCRPRSMLPDVRPPHIGRFAIQMSFPPSPPALLLIR
jgi:hypothetical protein